MNNDADVNKKFFLGIGLVSKMYFYWNGPEL